MPQSMLIAESRKLIDENVHHARWSVLFNSLGAYLGQKKFHAFIKLPVQDLIYLI